MRKKLITFFYLTIIIVACKLTPPNKPEQYAKTGKIVVKSNVKDALILLDDNATSKYTPDTITANVGEHTLELQKENYISEKSSVNVLEKVIIEKTILMSVKTINKAVLIEDFGNVSCVPCVTSNKILEIISKQYSKEKLVKIKYPTNFPSSNDLFYLENPTACDEKISFYSVFSTPTVVIDGLHKPIATDSIEIKNFIDKRLKGISHFNITGNDSIISGTNEYFIKILLETKNITGFDFSKIFLFAVVVEKKISFSKPPGSNGEKVFYDIMREILPTANGLPLNEVSSDSSFYNFEFKTKIKSAWHLNELSTVVFIQNKESKEVYQTVIIE